MYSSEAFAKGDKKVIWELLYDIWSYYRGIISGNVNKSPFIQCRLEKSAKKTPISLKEGKLKNTNIEEVYNDNNKSLQSKFTSFIKGMSKNNIEVDKSKIALNIVSYYSDVPSLNLKYLKKSYSENTILSRRSPSPKSLRNHKLSESSINRIILELGTNNSKENGVFITMDHKSVDKVRIRK